MNQFLHRASNVFDRHIQVNPMLIEQVDGLNFEPLKRAFDRLLDVLALAVHGRRYALHAPGILVRTDVEPELGGNHHLPAKRSERFANELFVQPRAVDFGRVKECDASIHGGMEEIGHLLLILWWTIGKTHSHAAKTEG